MIVKHEYGVDILNILPQGEKFNVVVLSIEYDKFKGLDIDFLLQTNHVFYDVKGMIPEQVGGRL